MKRRRGSDSSDSWEWVEIDFDKEREELAQKELELQVATETQRAALSKRAVKLFRHGEEVKKNRDVAELRLYYISCSVMIGVDDYVHPKDRKGMSAKQLNELMFKTYSKNIKSRLKDKTISLWTLNNILGAFEHNSFLHKRGHIVESCQLCDRLYK